MKKAFVLLILSCGISCQTGEEDLQQSHASNEDPMKTALLDLKEAYEGYNLACENLRGEIETYDDTTDRKYKNGKFIFDKYCVFVGGAGVTRVTGRQVLHSAGKEVGKEIWKSLF